MNVSVPSFDDELLKVHLAQAAHSLPGPDYYTVLDWIHAILEPATYVEIGVRNGNSLCKTRPETRCVAIDPAPNLDEPLRARTRVFALPSDEFFASYNLADVMGSPSFTLAFIDGLHLFEQALRDFIYLEQFAGACSIIMLHDCLPLDQITSARIRTTHFYSGDVWKLTMCLRNHRPDLRMTMIETGPTGLCLVGGLDPNSEVLAGQYERLIAEYVPLTFEDYQQRRGLMPAAIPNNFDAVRSCTSQLVYPG